MWIEYVREGLQKGQQVFRRSVVEALLEEVEQQQSNSGDSAEVATLKRDLAIAKKQYRDLNIRFHQYKSQIEGKGAMPTSEAEGEIPVTLNGRPFSASK